MTASPTWIADGALSSEGDVDDDRSPWRPVLGTVAAAYLVGTIAFTAVGLLFLHVGAFDSVRAWDLDVSRWFARHRSPGWDGFAMFWSNFADTLAIVGVAALAALILWRQERRRAVAVVVLGLVVEAGVFISTNHLVRRERPPADTLGEAPSTFSFPSGHVAATIVLYGALALILAAVVRATVLRALVLLVPVAFAASVGFSRVYRGMHFTTDVLAGALLGVLALAAVLVATQALAPDSLEDRS